LLIAVDENRNRLSPRKGLTAYCQLCGNPVRAHCGDIYIHHWKHIVEQNCDPWKEHETEWHKSWKNEFPKDWQEVIIIRDNEKHVADIQTPNGLVLELQNSSISSSTIEEREAFYQSIIWLVNAETFKTNFRISSAVKRRLREAENQYHGYSSYRDQDSPEIQDFKEQIEKCKSEIINLNYEISTLESRHSKIIEHRDNLDNALSQCFRTSDIFSNILDEFNCVEKEIISSVRSKKEEVNEDLESVKGTLQTIENLPNSQVSNYEHYKLVTPTEVSSSSYPKCVLVEKASKDSLFPTILKFRSEQEFEQIAKNQKYILIVDPTDAIANLTTKINLFESEISELDKTETKCLESMKTQLTEFLAEQRNLCVSELRTAKEKVKKADQRIEILAIKIEKREQYESEQREIELKEMEELREAERSDIMKRFKGQYYYGWSHRRPSWDYAYGRIFLDFGTHIFELLSDTKLRKISKLQFVELIKNWR
jgi:hypothetical protein